MDKKWNRSTLAWASYDWANSAFATTVIAAFFPIFFKKFWSLGVDPQESTFYLGVAMSGMAVVMALLAPLLGIYADSHPIKKKGLLIAASLGATATMGFFFVGSGHWLWALGLYGLASVGFAGGNLFYDMLLVDLVPKKHLQFASGLGYGLGYLGGGLLVTLHALMITSPEHFGLSGAAEAVQWAFLSVGLWWLVFTLPLAIFVGEKPPHGPKKELSQGFAQLRTTFHAARKNKNLWVFLLAYFFYIDGVGTIYKMAVDFALAIGLESKNLILAIIVVQFVGFPATLLFAWAAQKSSEKTAILGGVIVYAVACVLGAFMQNATHFYALAATIGCVQGGVQAMSRSLYGRLIPAGQAGEYFGFYNMFGKFSAILGPLLVGLTAFATGSSRASLGVIVLLFAIGGWLLTKVSTPKTHPKA